MTADYPPDFPLAAQLKVEIAKDHYSKKLKRRMQKLMPGPRDSKAVYYLQPRRRLGKHFCEREDLLLICISAIWRTFVSEAARLRLWPQSNDWDWRTMEFLQQLIYEFYGRSEFGWGRQSTVNPRTVDDTVKRVMQQIQGSKPGQYLKDVRREMLKALVESAATEAPAVSSMSVSVEKIPSGEARVKQSPPVKRRKRRKRKPSTKATAPEENAETRRELSYDEKTQVLRFRKMSFAGVDRYQFAAIKCLYDLPEDSAGMSGEDVMKEIGRPINRFQNHFQREDRAILDALIDYDAHERLYRFKFSRNKSHQN